MIRNCLSKENKKVYYEWKKRGAVSYLPTTPFSTRKYITQAASIAMYKQMILPLFYYNVFLLISCNLEQKRKLKKGQNNAIRTCLMYARPDHITIDRSHIEMRNIQISKPVQLLRVNIKTKFKLMTKCTVKYQNSPSNKGTILLDTLPANDHHSESIIIIAKHVLKVRLR